MTDRVTISLSEEDSIVLFELLHRLQAANTVSISDAERESVDGLIGAFERELVAPFRSDYLSLVERILRDREARIAADNLR